MLSYNAQYTLYQQLTSDTDATNLAMGKTFITQGQRKLETELRIYFTEETRTFTTVTDAISGTSNQAYPRPENFKTLTDLYVTVGTDQYKADLIQDPGLWRDLNATTTQNTGDYLQFCFIRQNRIELQPIPASANTATITYNSFSKPLVSDDYTTGTITTLANEGTAITGSGSTWTAGMVGRYLRIDADGEWYKISAFTSTTAITLATEYQGTAIAAGTSAYTIGQMPITPPETHELPVYYAVWRWALMKKDILLAREFEKMWKEGILAARANWANISSSNIVGSSRRRVGKIIGYGPHVYGGDERLIEG